MKKVLGSPRFLNLLQGFEGRAGLEAVNNKSIVTIRTLYFFSKSICRVYIQKRWSALLGTPSCQEYYVYFN